MIQIQTHPNIFKQSHFFTTGIKKGWILSIYGVGVNNHCYLVILRNRPEPLKALCLMPWHYTSINPTFKYASRKTLKHLHMTLSSFQTYIDVISYFTFLGYGYLMRLKKCLVLGCGYLKRLKKGWVLGCSYLKRLKLLRLRGPHHVVPDQNPGRARQRFRKSRQVCCLKKFIQKNYTLIIKHMDSKRSKDEKEEMKRKSRSKVDRERAYLAWEANVDGEEVGQPTGMGMDNQIRLNACMRGSRVGEIVIERGRKKGIPGNETNVGEEGVGDGQPPGFQVGRGHVG